MGDNEKKDDLSLVTVIVPVYNVSKYLRKCLDSVILQTYDHLDIIIIDDGSTDNSGSICDEYSASDKRITVFHTNNNGLAAARNLGIRNAKGEFIVFLDSDDWMEYDAIQILTRIALMTNADIVSCQYYYEWLDKSIVSTDLSRISILTGKEILESHINEPYIANVAWNKIYKTGLFNTIEYPVGRAFEDIFTTFRLLLAAEKVVCIPDVLVHYRMRRDSIGKSHDIQNLKDYWQAYYERYNGLKCSCQSLNMVKALGDCMGAIGRMWRWYAGCTSEEKAAAVPMLVAMQQFAADHRGEIINNSKCSIYQRFSCICAGSRNELFLRVLYIATIIGKIVSNRKQYKF